MRCGVRRCTLFILGSLLLLPLLFTAACAKAPEAFFSANPTSGPAPLTVNFADQSKNKPTQWSWDFGDGTNSNEQNPSHIYTKVSTYTIKLNASNDKGPSASPATAQVTVSPGSLDKVVLDATTATLTPQRVQRFSVKAFDAYGNEISGVSFSWTATPGAGSVSSEGIFTAGTKAGSYPDAIRLEAVHQGMTRSASASVAIHPGPLDKVTLKPDSTTLTPEETQQFTLQAFDAHGNEVTGFQASWKVVKEGGSVNDRGLFTAGTKVGTFAGTVQMEATKEGGTRSAAASITVVPGAINRVTVTPASADLNIGGTQQYQTKGFDRFDNEIPNLTFQWSSNVGTVDAQGLLTAGTKAGAFPEAVKAEASHRGNTQAASAAVTIKPDPLAKVVLEPGSATLAVQGTQQFALKPQDKYGNQLSGLSGTWSVTKGGGAIDQQGLFTAGTLPGSYKDTVLLRVAQGAVSLEATALVVVNPGPLDQVVLAPNPADIGMGMQQQLVAAGADRFGNRISGLTFTWRVEGGGGTIDAKGLFTAGSQPGTYNKTVTATASQGSVTRSGTASVTVHPDRIAFLSDRSDGWGLYIMDADGKNQKQLTTGVATEALSWSPDGRRIVYSTGALAIVAMGDDGSWKVSLFSEFRAGDPAWSPDGSKIAFDSDKDGNWEIYVMDVDRGKVTRLTNNSAVDYSPTWSPDSKKIAFVSRRDGNEEIYMMKADGSDQLRWTNSIAADLAPAWSPDGTQILFQSVWGGQWNIFVTNVAGGSSDRQLTTFSSSSSNTPSWSTDGSKILFHSYRDSDKAEIYIMDKDGGNVTRLTTNQANDWRPRWAPRKRGVAVSEASIVIPRSSALKEMSVAELTAQASKAVVRIETDRGSGSGFIIDPNGLILTNNHVIMDAKKITVHLPGGTSYAGTVLGRDIVRDLAVVKIEATGLPYLEIGDLSEVSQGSEAVVVGYPLGEKTASVTRGIVSAFIFDGGRNVTWVKTDAPINPGNSGGPLLNLRGQVIGVVAAKYVGIGLEGLGYGISASTVRLYLERLKAGEVITS